MIRDSPAVRAVRDASQAPVQVSVLADQLSSVFPGFGDKGARMIAELVRLGSLRGSGRPWASNQNRRPSTRSGSRSRTGCPGRLPGDIMAGMNVRRLAAIDMYGARGTTRRRRIVVAEFVAGVVVSAAFGSWLTAHASGPGGRVLGIWMIGAGLNYAPLAAHAITLTRPGALSAELAGVDTGQELRRYSVLQLWIFLPLSLVALASRSAVTRRAHSREIRGTRTATRPDSAR